MYYIYSIHIIYTYMHILFIYIYIGNACLNRGRSPHPSVLLFHQNDFKKSFNWGYHLEKNLMVWAIKYIDIYIYNMRVRVVLQHFWVVTPPVATLLAVSAIVHSWPRFQHRQIQSWCAGVENIIGNIQDTALCHWTWHILQDIARYYQILPDITK